MKVLELFKGSGSVGKYCEKYPEMYDVVVSLDIYPNSNATYTTDLMLWDYKQFPSGHFDIIWASSPCIVYLLLLYPHIHKGNRVRDFETADGLVKKTLEIIEYFKPKVWFIENPDTGLLKSRPFMNDLPYYVVSYCKYGFDYRKNTRIWTNLENYNALRCK